MDHHILVVEDEPTLARLLVYNLNQEGYRTTVADNGVEGLRLGQQAVFDLIILDLMLPGLGGFDVLAKLRQRGMKMPIIILTARNAEEEIVQGLKLGADDYMTKPFGVAELLARVAAVLRRAEPDAAEPGRLSSVDKVIQIGELQIYPDKYEASLQESVIPLRPKEFEILLYLAQRPGVVVTRDDVMNAVWGFDYIGGQRTVDVHVSSLRKKLELDQQKVKIEALRGIGYKLVVAR